MPALHGLAPQENPTLYFIFDTSRSDLEYATCADFLGYPIEEFVGLDRWRQIAHPDDFERMTAHWSAVVEGRVEPDVAFEYRVRRKSGEWAWLAGWIHPLPPRDNGRTSRFGVVLLDFTERMRLQAELQRRERELLPLNELLQALTTRSDYEETQQLITNYLVDMFGGDGGCLALWDATQEMAVPSTYAGKFTQQCAALCAPDDWTALVKPVVESGDSLAIPDAAASDILQRVGLQHQGVQALRVLPLTTGEEELGAVFIFYAQPQVFDPDDLSLAQKAARQISLALAKERALQREREQRVLAEALQAAGATLNSSLDPDVVLQELVLQLADVVPYDTASVVLIENGIGTFAALQLPDDYPPVERKALARSRFIISETRNLHDIYTAQEPLIIPDVLEYPGWVNLEVLRKIRSWMGVPILLEGRVRAVFAITKSEPDFYTSWHLQVLEAFSEVAALALRNAEQYAAKRQQLQNLSLLHDIAVATAASKNIGGLMRRVTGILAGFKYLEVFRLVLLDEDPMAYTAVQGDVKATRLDQAALQEGLLGETLRTGKPCSTTDSETSAQLCVPITSGGRVFGAICAQRESDASGPFAASDISLMMTLAGQLGTAVARLRSRAAERTRRTESSTLREAAAIIGESLQPLTVMERLLEQVQRVVPYDVGSAWLVEHDRARFLCQLASPRYQARVAATPPETLSFALREEGPLSTVLHSVRPLVVPDLQTFEGWQVIPGYEFLRAGVTVPVLSEGQVVAFIGLSKDQPDFYDRRHVALLGSFASLAGVALQNARLFQATRRQVDELQVLHAVAAAGAEAHCEDAFLQQVTEIIGDALYPDSFGFLLLDLARDVLVRHASYRSGAAVEEARAAIALGEGVCGRVAQEARPYRIADVKEDPNYSVSDPQTRSMLCVPLRSGDAVLGVANVESHELNAFGDDDERLLLTLAGQVATVLSRIRSQVAEAQRRREAEVLQEATAVLSETLDTQTVLTRLLEQVEKLVDYDAAVVWTVRGPYIYAEGLRVVEHVSDVRQKDLLLEPLELARSGVVAEITRSLQPLLIEDVYAYEGWIAAPGWEFARACAVFPILIEDRVGAFFALYHREVGHFTPEHAQLLAAFANHAVVALHNAQLYESTRRRLDELEVLHAISTVSASATGEDELIERVTQIIGDALYPDAFGIGLVDAVHGEIRVHSSYYYTPGSQEGWQPSLDDGLAGRVVTEGRPYRIGDVRQEPDYVPSDEAVRSKLAVPIKSGERVLGLLNVESTAVDAFTAEDERLLDTVAGQMATAIERLRALETERRRREEADALREATETIGQSLDQHTVLSQLLLQIERLVPYDSGAVWVIQDGSARMGSMHGKAPYASEERRKILQQVSIEIAKSKTVREISRTQQPLIVDDVREFEGWRTFPGGEYIRANVTVPIIFDGAVQAYFGLDKAEPNHFTPDHVRHLQAFSGYAAAALQKARLFDEVQRRVDELQVLYAVGVATTEARGEHELIRRVTDIVGNALYTSNFGVVLLNEAGTFLEIHPTYRWSPTAREIKSVPVGEGICGHVIDEGRPYRSADVTQDPGFIVTDPETRSKLCVPILSRQRVLRAINVESPLLNAYSAGDERLVVTLAGQLAVGLERIRLQVVDRVRRQQAEALQQATAVLSQSLNSQIVLSQLLAQVARVVPYDVGTIWLVNNGEASPVSMHGLEQFADATVIVEARKVVLTAENAPSVRHLLSTKQPLVLPDVREFEGWVTPPGWEFVRSSINIPIIMEGSVRAFFGLFSQQLGQYDARSVELLSAFADHVAAALQNASLFESTRRQLEDLRVLHAVALAASELEDEDALIERITQILVGVFYGETLGFALLDEDGRRLIPHASYRRSVNAVLLDSLGLGQGVEGLVASEGRPYRIPDVSKVPAYVAEDPETRSELCVPLKVGQRVLGVINLESPRLNAYSQEHERLLLTIAGQAATAIDRIRTHSAEVARRREAETLREASAVITSTLRLEDVLGAILAQLEHVVDYDSASLLLLDGTNLRLVASMGKTIDLPRKSVEWPAESPFFRQMQATQRPIVLDDLQTAEFYGWAETRDTRSWLGMPLIFRGRVTGVLALNSRNLAAFGPNDIALVGALANQAATAVNNARLYESIQHHTEELQRAVTERTRELEEANARLRELDQLRAKFISDASHELRTPLANLTLYLDLLERSNSDRRERYQSVLRTQLERLNQLVEDVLALSRLESQVQQERKGVDLNELAQKVVMSQRPRAEALGLIVNLTQKPLPRVQGREAQLEQVLTNLIANAINYTRVGHIIVRTLRDDSTGCAGLQVEDTGIGISAEDIERLFERFYRGQEAERLNSTGSGLGLSILKEIVDQHDGSIEVTSEPGHGTIFTVWLPIEESSAA